MCRSRGGDSRATRLAIPGAVTSGLGVWSWGLNGISSCLKFLWRYHNPLGLLTYEDDQQDKREVEHCKHQSSKTSIKLAKPQGEGSRPEKVNANVLFFGVPGWLDEEASAFFSSASFSSATATCPLPTRWDLPVGMWLFPTSGQLSTSVTKDERCGDKRSSFRDEGVVPVLDPGVDEDAPLTLDDDGLWVDCTLAELRGSGCRVPDDTIDDS
jgi:hypothetical protein